MNNYVICTTQRSGSTLFSTTISNTDVLGKPSEKLLNLEQNFEAMSQVNKEYYKLPLDKALEQVRLEQSSENGIFGIKIMWSTMNKIIKGDQSRQGYLFGFNKLTNNWGRDTKFIFWRRKNKIKQAISHAVMRKVGQAHAKNQQELKKMSDGLKNAAITHEDIETELFRLFEHEMQWKRFFLHNNINTKVVYFEDFLCNKEVIIKDLASYIGTQFKFKQSLDEAPLLKVSNEDTDKLYNRFCEHISSTMTSELLNLYDCNINRGDI